MVVSYVAHMLHICEFL